MSKPQQQTSRTDDEAAVGGAETTLVAPRFDDEETLVARPVVPLEDEAHLPAPSPVHAPPARGHRGPFVPRRSGILALALASVLIGGVLGGAGLYFYQRQSEDPAVSPTATAAEQPAAPADDRQATPDAETNAEPQEARPAEAPAAAPDAAEVAKPAPDEEMTAAAPARRPESITAAERRPAPSEGAPRRGKKGERDEEVERHAPARPGGNVTRSAEPEARRVDSIVYRPRRAERRAARRARRDDDVDRLRRIFEGTPE